MPAGRPTKYKKIYCKKIVEHFEKIYEDFLKIDFAEVTTEQNKVERGKKSKVVKKRRGKFFHYPSLASFAIEIGIGKDAILRWASEHEEFHDAVMHCKSIQEKMNREGALNGIMPVNFVQLMMINEHDWVTKKEIEQKGDQTINLNYNLKDN